MPCYGKTEKAANIFAAYFTPIIVNFGLIGNINIFILCVRRGLQNRFNLYGLLLTTYHLIIILLNTFLLEFVDYGFSYMFYGNCYTKKIKTRSLASCKTFNIISVSMFTSSAWTSVMISVDRLSSILFPFKYNSTNTLFSIALCSCVVICSFLINIPVAVSSEIYNESYIGSFRLIPVTCELSVYKNVAYSQFHLFIHITVGYFFPIVSVAIIDGIIVSKYSHIRRRRQSITFIISNYDFQQTQASIHLKLSVSVLVISLPYVISMLVKFNMISTTDPDELINLKYAVDIHNLFSTIKDINYVTMYFVIYNNQAFFYIKKYWKLLRNRILKKKNAEKRHSSSDSISYSTPTTLSIQSIRFPDQTDT